MELNYSYRFKADKKLVWSFYVFSHILFNGAVCQFYMWFHGTVFNSGIRFILTLFWRGGGGLNSFTSIAFTINPLQDQTLRHPNKFLILAIYHIIQKKTYFCWWGALNICFIKNHTLEMCPWNEAFQRFWFNLLSLWPLRLIWWCPGLVQLRCYCYWWTILARSLTLMNRNFKKND